MFKLTSKILLFVALSALATSAYSLTDYVHKYKCELNLDKYSKNWISKSPGFYFQETEVATPMAWAKPLEGDWIWFTVKQYTSSVKTIALSATNDLSEEAEITISFLKGNKVVVNIDVDGRTNPIRTSGQCVVTRGGMYLAYGDDFEVGKACKRSHFRCDEIELCYMSTEKSPSGKRVWNLDDHTTNYRSEVKRRGENCDLRSAVPVVVNKTKPKPKPKPSATCTTTAKVCSDAVLCILATRNVGGKLAWEDSASRSGYVSEAKSRKLSCETVQKTQPAKPKPAKPKPNDSCLNDAASCSIGELCKYATQSSAGNTIWSTQGKYWNHVKLAKRMDMPCGVKKSSSSNLKLASTGTAFFVSNEGHMVTNAHVIDGCVAVKYRENGVLKSAKVLGMDKVSDVAVLMSHAAPVSYLSFAKSDPYNLQKIYVAGYPFGDRLSSAIKFTTGIVSAESGLGNNEAEVQIDAALQSGNSGGPIIAADEGGVVGIAVSKLNAKLFLEKYDVIPENVNFGVKRSIVLRLLDKLGADYEIYSGTSRSLQSLSASVGRSTVLLSCWK